MYSACKFQVVLLSDLCCTNDSDRIECRNIFSGCVPRMVVPHNVHDMFVESVAALKLEDAGMWGADTPRPGVSLSVNWFSFVLFIHIKLRIGENIQNLSLEISFARLVCERQNPSTPLLWHFDNSNPRALKGSFWNVWRNAYVVSPTVSLIAWTHHC